MLLMHWADNNHVPLVHLYVTTLNTRVSYMRDYIVVIIYAYVRYICIWAHEYVAFVCVNMRIPGEP